MPAKNKRVHTTKSVTAREQSNSPLQVKVQNNLARTKPKECVKQPLKSVVKVVQNKQAKGKSVPFSDQVSALTGEPTSDANCFRGCDGEVEEISCSHN